MSGRRSEDENPFFGFSSKFSEFKFPTKSDIIKHANEVKREMVSKGLWKQNVAKKEVAQKVNEDVRNIWEKTPIPITQEINSYKQVMKVLKEGEKLMKIPVERRDRLQSEGLNVLLNIAACKHIKTHNVTVKKISVFQKIGRRFWQTNEMVERWPS